MELFSIISQLQAIFFTTSMEVSVSASEIRESWALSFTFSQIKQDDL